MAKGKNAEKGKVPRWRDDNDNDAIGKMREDIQSLMYRRDEDQKKFMCPHRLKTEFWTKYDVKDIKAFRNYDNNVFPKIKQSYLIVLSILIWIKWDDLLLFNVRFVEAPEQDLNDENLVFDEAKLRRPEISSIFGFREAQYLFRPEVIIRKPDGWIQDIDPQRRLPFVESPEPIAKGGFAAVNRGRVAPFCLKDQYGKKVNEREVVFAVKQFYIDAPIRDFEREVNNLRFLKKRLNVNRAHILTHKAAIRHGDTFIILLPMVEHGTLDVLLRGGYQEGKTTSDERHQYDISERFPLLQSDANLHTALVEQAYHLADALKWLHHGLTKVGCSQDRYLAHMDLTPYNILIQGNPQDKSTPAGTWMISDFGISGFHEKTNEPVHAQDGTICNVATSLTRELRDDADRGHGSFQPPEVDLERKYKQLRDRRLHDYRLCDVWSFGCILSEILAFALGKREGVLNFRDKRLQGNDLNFFTFVNFPKEPDFAVTAANTQLKKPITDWMNAMLKTYADSWVSVFVEVLRDESLKPCPSDRADIEDVMTSLRDVLTKLNAAEYRGIATLRPASARLLATPDTRTNVGPDALHSPSNRPIGGMQASSGTAAAATQQGSLVSLGSSPQYHPGRPSVPQIVVGGAAQHGRMPDTPDSIILGSDSPNLPNANVQETETVASTDIQSASSLPLSTDLGNHRQISTMDGPFNSSSIVRVPGIEGEHIKSVALDLNGERIALLSKTHVFVFMTMNPSISDPKIPISAGVHWDTIMLTYPLLAIKGNVSKEVKAELYVLPAEEKVRDIDGEYKGDTLSDICLSRADAGIVVHVYAKNVQLYFLGFEIPIDLPISTEHASVDKVAFDACGRRLYLLLEGVDTDYVYMFEPDRINKNVRHFPRLSFFRESVPRSITSTSQLWPSPFKPFCIIKQNEGASMAQINTSQPVRHSEVRLQRDSIDNKCVAGLVYNNMLLCLEPHQMRRHKLIAYELNLMRGDSWSIIRKRHAMGKIDKRTETTAGMAILESADRLELVLYRSDKRIERYTQEKARH